MLSIHTLFAHVVAKHTASSCGRPASDDIVVVYHVRAKGSSEGQTCSDTWEELPVPAYSSEQLL